MNIETIKTIWADGELKQNTHIIIDNDGCIIVDAGCPLEQVRSVCDLPIKAVLLTHGHFDHIQYVEDYDKLDVPIYASSEIMDFLTDIDKNVSYWHNPETYSIDNLITLKDNQEIIFDKHKVKCYHTPGHSIDSVCYLVDDRFLFSGDTVFSVAVGRTDLPTGDKDTLIQSLNRLLDLDYVELYTGHGRTSNREEQMTNIPKWIERLKEMNI
ncbi:MAG: MBL fold metallo-hydrolase [Clostridia bacterium]